MPRPYGFHLVGRLCGAMCLSTVCTCNAPASARVGWKAGNGKWLGSLLTKQQAAPCPAISNLMIVPCACNTANKNKPCAKCLALSIVPPKTLASLPACLPRRNTGWKLPALIAAATLNNSKPIWLASYPMASPSPLLGKAMPTIPPSKAGSIPKTAGSVSKFLPGRSILMAIPATGNSPPTASFCLKPTLSSTSTLTTANHRLKPCGIAAAAASTRFPIKTAPCQSLVSNSAAQWNTSKAAAATAPTAASKLSLGIFKSTIFISAPATTPPQAACPISPVNGMAKPLAIAKTGKQSCEAALITTKAT